MLIINVGLMNIPTKPPETGLHPKRMSPHEKNKIKVNRRQPLVLGHPLFLNW